MAKEKANQEAAETVVETLVGKEVKILGRLVQRKSRSNH